jgi:hypothetical protein
MTTLLALSLPVVLLALGILSLGTAALLWLAIAGAYTYFA